MERAPKKISSVVTLSTESVKAERTESSKVETPDATSTASEKEKQEPLVVADGPEGAAAKKATAGPLVEADAEAEKVAQELYPEAAS